MINSVSTIKKVMAENKKKADSSANKIFIDTFNKIVQVPSSYVSTIGSEIEPGKIYFGPIVQSSTKWEIFKVDEDPLTGNKVFYATFKLSEGEQFPTQTILVDDLILKNSRIIKKKKPNRLDFLFK